MSRALWIGGLALVGVTVVGGVAYAASSKPIAKPKTTAPPRLISGHRYHFVALNPKHMTDAQLVTALEATQWGHPVIYHYGEANTPSDITWPPVADKSILYAVSAVWVGSTQDVPAGWVGSFFSLVDEGVET